MALLSLACSDSPAPPAETPGLIRLADAWPQARFERPLCVTHAGDASGRMFVVEQDGRIWVLPTDDGGARAQVFLDLRTRVRRDHNEEGLLALAFHPRYETNGFLYVYYSASDPLRNVLARYRADVADSNRADPSSHMVVLEIGKPYGNHNGATLAFGPDGALYVSIGDGGSGGDPHGNGQSLATLLGKILRLDVDAASGAYSIPPDNPFVGVPEARGEIWAYGLRNVWRMSFDRATGTLWAGDVGQNRWEEIDVVARGGNYGWNLREGRHAYRVARAGEELIDPVWEYSHDDGASVTGGYVYRGTRWPDLLGWYVFGDYISGTIWAIRQVGTEVEHRVLLRQTKNVASFGEDEAGELYLAAFDGHVYRIESTVEGGR
jgi:glucose/arabinose dehydrogenase